MRGTFHLVDLWSQALAGQRLLKGHSEEEKLAWLAARGKLFRFLHPNAKPTYIFVSSIGLEVPFFFDGDEFVLVGDHTTYKGASD